MSARVQEVCREANRRGRRAIGDRQQDRLVDLLQRHGERCVGMPDGISGELAHDQPYVFDEIQEPVVDQMGADEVTCPRNALDFCRELRDVGPKPCWNHCSFLVANGPELGRVLDQAQAMEHTPTRTVARETNTTRLR